jgi:hypothetical protein
MATSAQSKSLEDLLRPISLSDKIEQTISWGTAKGADGIQDKDRRLKKAAYMRMNLQPHFKCRF